nr:unnamed protein product [Callosobruchus chinensis]
MACDTGTKYMLKYWYLGKHTCTDGVTLGEYYVKKLTEKVHGSNTKGLSRSPKAKNTVPKLPLPSNLPFSSTL